MIKIRLQGTLPEVNDAICDIKQIFRVLECSAPYPNRGNSEYYRVYIDAEIPTDIDVLEKALEALEILGGKT